MGFLGQWEADAQRKGDERADRWQARERERARTGRTTVRDRLAARAQRKGDEAAARWLELDPFWQLVQSGPARGPLGSTAVIRVYSTAWPWGVVVSGGAGGGAIVFAALLVVAAIRWLIYGRSRSWTVLARCDGHPNRILVRVRSQLAACRAAADLFGRFQADGPAALESWRAEVMASNQVPGGNADSRPRDAAAPQRSAVSQDRGSRPR